MRLWLVTTFANAAWERYASACLHSLNEYLPHAVKLCVCLDDDALYGSVKHMLDTRPHDGMSMDKRGLFEIFVGRGGEHQAFINQFKTRDHPTEYRLQATRFCHKVFVLKGVMDKAIQLAQAIRPTHIIWWDADARLTRAVTPNELEALMPAGDEAVSYLGRRDWDHSECGFMGFSLEQGGTSIIDFMHTYYVQGLVFSLPQWHDSYLFDVARKNCICKNISDGVPGNNVWAATALGKFSEHWKGESAKERNRPMTDRELFEEGL